MKKKILFFGFIISFLIISNSGFGQLSMSFQYSSDSKIGIGYNFSQRIWSELRIYSNTYLEGFTPELVVLYNVSVKDRHEIYIGAGGVINGFSGIVIPVGLQFRPLEDFKRFSIQIEFEPMLDFSDVDLTLAFLSSAGIRYTFGKKEKQQP